MTDIDEPLYNTLRKISNEVREKNFMNKMKAHDIIKDTLKDVREDICKSTICGKNYHIYHFKILIPEEAFMALIKSEYKYIIHHIINESLRDYTSHFTIQLLGDITSKKLILEDNEVSRLFSNCTTPYNIQISWSDLINSEFIDTEIYKECQICLTEKNEEYTILHPCGHSGYCKECIEKMNACPRCRHKIEDNNNDNNTFLHHILYLYKLSVKYKKYTNVIPGGIQEIIKNIKDDFYMIIRDGMLMSAKKGESQYECAIKLSFETVFTIYQKNFLPEKLLTDTFHEFYGKECEINVLGCGELKYKINIAW